MICELSTQSEELIVSYGMQLFFSKLDLPCSSVVGNVKHRQKK